MAIDALQVQNAKKENLLLKVLPQLENKNHKWKRTASFACFCKLSFHGINLESSITSDCSDFRSSLQEPSNLVSVAWKLCKDCFSSVAQNNDFSRIETRSTKLSKRAIFRKPLRGREKSSFYFLWIFLRRRCTFVKIRIRLGYNWKKSRVQLTLFEVHSLLFYFEEFFF